MRGADNRFLILGSALLGGTLLSVADLIARVALRPAELPIGIVTSVVGVPVFVIAAARPGSIFRNAEAPTDLVFRVGTRALVDDVSRAFEPGRLHLIIGPNGAGKSTLIKVLARLLGRSGHVLYDGADIARTASEHELARRGQCCRRRSRSRFLPVREVVMMGRYPHFGARPGASDGTSARGDALLRRRRDGGPQLPTLSGGEKQRVKFARVLAQVWRPIEGAARYLFLDEPLTFLDIRHQIDFMKR